MFTVLSAPSGRSQPLSLYRIIYLCTAWLQAVQGQPHPGTGDYAAAAFGDFGLIPSAPGPASTPSPLAPSQSGSTGLVPSAPFPSEQPSQAPQPSDSLITPTPSVNAPPDSLNIPLVPSSPVAPGPGPIPSAPTVTNAPPSINSSRATTVGKPQMTSTDQGLKPIPPAETQVGDPNGHHEITEPNFSATIPCRGCSPIIEITATGWLDNGPEEQHETPTRIIQTRVSAGPSNILVSQAPSGGKFVIGGSLTVTPGQTVTIDKVPIVIQTAADGPQVIVGTTVIPLIPDEGNPDAKPEGAPRVTYMPTPIPALLTIGADTITPDSQSQYIVGGQTLSPGAAAITVSGTTISLAPSATAVVVNGVSSTLTPRFGNIWTTAAPALTFKNQVYTANRAGYITISPGTVLKPGAAAITIDGTTLSLDHSGTVIVVQGVTSILQPVTTVVTLTRSLGPGGIGCENAGDTSGGTWVLPTGKAPGVAAKQGSAGLALTPAYTGNDGWLGGIILLIWWSIGYLAVEL